MLFPYNLIHFISSCIYILVCLLGKLINTIYELPFSRNFFFLVDWLALGNHLHYCAYLHISFVFTSTTIIALLCLSSETLTLLSYCYIFFNFFLIFLVVWNNQSLVHRCMYIRIRVRGLVRILQSNLS